MKVKDLVTELLRCNPDSEVQAVNCPIHEEDIHYIDIDGPHNDDPNEPTTLYVHLWQDPNPIRVNI
jgi:hypothetical protein